MTERDDRITAYLDGSMTDDEMAALAAYYASLKRP